ncbi:MAG: ATP-dependent helicase, partial [Candidatus Limnocylindria bacterium]
STQTILDAAHAVVSRNAGRKDKRLWTDRGAGTHVTLFDAYNEYEEAEFVARQVERLVAGSARGSMRALLTRRADDGDGAMRYGDIAVTYRINAQSRVLEESFMRFGIPYQLVGGTRFYERREVKDALAYVRLARNSADRVALERIINVPARGIGAKTLDELRAWAEARQSSLWEAVEGAGTNPNLAPRARGALAAFADLMRGLMAMVDTEPPSALFDAALERSGIKDVLLDGTEDGEERWANVTELRNHAAEYDDIAAPEGLARFLEEVALVSDQDELVEAPDRVTLITLHAAKGLEFPAVFIVGLEEGLLPHRRALEDEREMEEERRLAYVGMTRAKDRLYLVHAMHRSTYGVGATSEASRFLTEVPEELIASERTAAPYRRGGAWPRGTDDAEWLPGGYRSPTRRVRETLRPVSLPDMAAPVGAGGARYEPGPDVDLGSGTFVTATVASSEPAAVAWQAGDQVRHRRYGIGRVVASEVIKGEEEVTVDFDEHGRKHLIVAYAGLERAEGAAGG